MLIHNFDPVAIDLNFLQIRWYSLAYIFGILIGWFYGRKIISKLRVYNNFSYLKIDDFDDLIPYLIIGIIIGGRIGYVFLYNLEYYINNLLEIFYIWEGGMSFHGALVGIVFSTILFCNKKKIQKLVYFDIISCVTPIGLFLGRISNFINGELYGKKTELPWGVVFPKIDSLTRHPSQIYEALMEGLILFVILNFLAFKKKVILNSGTISMLFVFLYSLFRILIEFYREPDYQLGYIIYSFSMGQVLSVFMIFFSILVYLKIK